MKQLATILFLSLSVMVNAQEKRQYTGLNKFIPTNLYIGMKWQANQYFPTYKLIADDAAFSSSISAKDDLGAGGGFFFRFEVKEHFSFQPEFNFQFRSGSVQTNHTYVKDTMIVVSKNVIRNYQTLSIEVPLYAKFRWEFTSLRKGHYKSNSALGLFFGPRLGVAPVSKMSVARNTQTIAYEQTSNYIDNDVALTDTRYAPIGSLGAAAGIDFEHHSGFIAHASFYRGFFSHSKKSNGFTALDNRIEVGIGVRFR